MPDTCPGLDACMTAMAGIAAQRTLELISTSDLVDELARRHDAVVMGLYQLTSEKTDDQQLFALGSAIACKALVFDLSTYLSHARPCPPEEEDSGEPVGDEQ
jgi:hypothetical protein